MAKKNADRQAYCIGFFPTGGVRFSHLTNAAYENEKRLSNVYVAGEAKLEVNGLRD